MSTFSDFDVILSGGGQPSHKHKGGNGLKPERCRKAGHGDHHWKGCPDCHSAKGRSKDKEISKNDGGPTNGENNDTAATNTKTMDKQLTSILEKG